MKISKMLKIFWLWKKAKEQYEVTYYMNSGQTFVVTFGKEKLVEMYSKLRQEWKSYCWADGNWGINFACVTHYKVKRIS